MSRLITLLLTGMILTHLTNGQVQLSASDLIRFLTYQSDERPEKKEASSGALGCAKNRDNRAASVRRRNLSKPPRSHVGSWRPSLPADSAAADPHSSISPLCHIIGTFSSSGHMSE